MIYLRPVLASNVKAHLTAEQSRVAKDRCPGSGSVAGLSPDDVPCVIGLQCPPLLLTAHGGSAASKIILSWSSLLTINM